jgi:hypothetical protein
MAEEIQGRIPNIPDNPPQQMTIRGMDLPYIKFLEGYAGNRLIRDIIRNEYKQKWDEFLPFEYYNESTKKIEVTHAPWSMAYVPQICLRKAIKNPLSKKELQSGPDNWPYFVLVLNSARDDRPQTPVGKDEDLLQKNILDRKMIIADVGKFYLTPNGFPYHKYASLLISKEKGRPQKKVSAEDISEWLKFSLLTGQNLFFNSVGAGASRPERFHAQVVDPQVLYFEGKPIEYPLMKAPRIGTKKNYFEITDYPIEARIYTGQDAPFEIASLVNKAELKNNAYNIFVSGSEVYFIPRNKENEISHCVGKKFGCYEILGINMIGNVEEPLMGSVGLLKMLRAPDIFSELQHHNLWNNIHAAGGSFS